MLGIGLCLQTFSCTQKLNPKQPEEKYNEVKAQSAGQLSVINVPVTVSMVEVEKQINAQLKDLIYEDNSLENNGNDNFLIKVWKREPITVNAVSDVFNITVPLRIWAKGELPFDKIGLNISEFKETEFTLNVHFISKVSVDTSWQVHTTTFANGFDWVHKPTLKIGFIELSLAPIANRIIDKQQDRLAQLVDKQVEQKINIKKYVQQAWKAIQQPLLLSKEYNTWLKMIPTEILMTPFSGQGKQARALVGIKGYTQTTIGQKPSIDSTKKILPLQTVKEIPDAVSIGLSGEVSHEYATEVLKNKFLNQEFSLSEGKYNITLTDIDLYGSGDDLIIKADLAGSLEGTIYLKGKPYFDPESQTLSLLNLDYDLDTKNKLIKTASWLAKGKFIKSMQEAFRIPLGNHIEQAKELIQANLANKQLAKGVVLNGQIEELTPADVYITPTSIIATVLATGKVNVNIEGL
jgi:hypothetical protein